MHRLSCLHGFRTTLNVLLPLATLHERPIKQGPNSGPSTFRYCMTPLVVHPMTCDTTCNLIDQLPDSNKCIQAFIWQLVLLDCSFVEHFLRGNCLVETSHICRVTQQQENHVYLVKRTITHVVLACIRVLPTSAWLTSTYRIWSVDLCISCASPRFTSYPSVRLAIFFGTLIN